MMLRALVLVSCINFVVSHESESRKWFGNVIISKLEVVVQLTGSLIFFPCLFSLWLISFFVLVCLKSSKCRQKTMDFAAACAIQKGNKLCTLKFCHKCLLNRLAWWRNSRITNFVKQLRRFLHLSFFSIHFGWWCFRYGEKAEDVALLDDWQCPKCRGICNCSFCM